RAGGGDAPAEPGIGVRYRTLSSVCDSRWAGRETEFSTKGLFLLYSEEPKMSEKALAAALTAALSQLPDLRVDAIQESDTVDFVVHLKGKGGKTVVLLVEAK